MRRVVLVVGAVVVAIAAVGCGGTDTKTVVTVESHTTTVTSVTTNTVSGSAAPTTVTKCGRFTSYCPVVVACPSGGGRSSTFECRGVVGVLGDHIVEPRPGPDSTGLGLTCSWSNPAYDRTTGTFLYVCNTDSNAPVDLSSIRTLGEFASQPLIVREQVAIRVLTTNPDKCQGGLPTPLGVARNIAPELATFRPGKDVATGKVIPASMPIADALSFAEQEIGC